jgi:ribosomal protein S4
MVKRFEKKEVYKRKPFKRGRSPRILRRYKLYKFYKCDFDGKILRGKYVKPQIMKYLNNVKMKSLQRVKIKKMQKGLNFYKRIYYKLSIRAFIAVRLLKMYYIGINKRQWRNIIELARKGNKLLIEEYLNNVEGRLDVILFRANFCNNLKEAKIMIKLNNILINNKVINQINYKIKRGDRIKIKDKIKFNIVKRLSRKGVKWKGILEKVKKSNMEYKFNKRWRYRREIIKEMNYNIEQVRNIRIKIYRGIIKYNKGKIKFNRVKKKFYKKRSRSKRIIRKIIKELGEKVKGKVKEQLRKKKKVYRNRRIGEEIKRVKIITKVLDKSRISELKLFEVYANNMYVNYNLQEIRFLGDYKRIRYPFNIRMEDLISYYN